jgi:hypothetical protein
MCRSLPYPEARDVLPPPRHPHAATRVLREAAWGTMQTTSHIGDRSVAEYVEILSKTFISGIGLTLGAGLVLAIAYVGWRLVKRVRRATGATEKGSAHG